MNEMSRHSNGSWHHAWPVVVVAEAVAAVSISLEGWFLLPKSEFCLEVPPVSYK